MFAEVTGAERVDAGYREAIEFSRRVYKLARLATGSRRFARGSPPTSPGLERHYELFFPIFNSAYELYALAALPDWRRRSRLAACFVSELWCTTFLRNSTMSSNSTFVPKFERDAVVAGRLVITQKINP